MARATSGTTVSLFPFLAVLVCVMGSLIFLLLATTKRMHELAVAEAESQWQAAQVPPEVTRPAPVPILPEEPAIESPVPDLGEPTPPISIAPAPEVPTEPSEVADQRRQREAECQAELARLQRRRDELQHGLQKQRLLKQAAQKKSAALEQEIADSETRLRGVLAQIIDQKEDLAANRDLSDLEQQIMELRRTLRQLQNRPSEGETKFTVIPFDVRSGTTRRPILIECTDHGLRFLPEDIVIKPSDLEGFTEQFNPLLSGASALMSYWTAWNMQQPQPEDKPEPYVLLIVRPNGTVAYYVAMRMLSSLKQAHGYELIDDSIELQPPPVDPAARQACQAAIDRLLADRAPAAQQARNGFRTGPGGNRAGERGGKLRAKTSDTFEVADVVPDSNQVGERSWENIERFEGRPPKRTSQEGGSRGTNRTEVKAAPRAASSPQQPPLRNASAPRELPETPDESPDGASRRQPANSDAAPRRALPDNRPSGLARQPARGRSRDGSLAGGELHLAQLGRRHWGQSEPNATIGIEQDVTIRVDARQLLVADDRVVRSEPGDESIDLFLRMMEAVDAEAQTWGKPRPGFYWTPRLRFVVSPGGNQLFERVDPLTIRSGLSTTREFTLEGVAPVKSEGRP